MEFDIVIIIFLFGNYIVYDKLVYMVVFTKYLIYNGTEGTFLLPYSCVPQDLEVG